MDDYADVTPGLVHAGPFYPGVGHGVIAADGVEMITAIKTTNHVYEIVQSAQPVICSRGQVHMY